MSQHDMDVANGAGVVVRADINAALQALASSSSGSSAPSPSFPCQLWADTGTSRLKRRNLANSAWLDEGPLDAALRDAASQGEFISDTGAANAYVCNFVPALTVRSESTPLRFKVANANTTASTINDGIGTVSLVGAAHAALQGGELIANGIAWVQWNASVGGGSYVLLFCTGAPQQVADATKSKHAVTAGQIVQQTLVAFTTGGTAGALTLTPSPAISAYAAPLRYRVKFSQASTGTDTINVSAIGAKSIKQYDSTGAKVAAVFAANQLADVEYDGVDFVLLDQLPVNAVQTRQSARGISRLIASANGTSSNIQFSIDEAVVAGSSGPSTVLEGINLALNTAATASATVSGMVGGATVASTWYAVYAHYNPSSGATILTGDANFSAPTAAPAAGFTQWCRISSFRTDATVNKYPLKYDQNGNDFDIWPLAGTNRPAVPIIASGSSGNVSTPTWTQVSISSIVPPTAKAIGLLLNATSQSVTIASPTGTHGDYTSTSNPPPMVVASTTAGNSTAGYGWSVISMMMTLQTLNVFRASNGTSFMACYGWRESL